ncbi:MAG TPA: DUF5658 family protein [Kofleriaceae bacterium]|nr:DUF5658 family protein [Kofleriaceae bacterium]
MQVAAVRVAREPFLFWVAAGILVLNLLDAMLTLTAVQSGAASEANPLMDVSLAWGGVWFVLVKLSLVSLGVQLLWRLRHLPLAATALLVIGAIYAGLIAYQLSGLHIIASHAV